MDNKKLVKKQFWLALDYLWGKLGSWRIVQEVLCAKGYPCKSIQTIHNWRKQDTLHSYKYLKGITPSTIVMEGVIQLAKDKGFNND